MVEYRQCQSDEAGFSLVELAIVLVVMGLLVSVTLVGQVLVRAAEIRGMIAEAENYKLQVDNFMVRFNDLPGDLRKANDYWAEATDGDANGKIEESEVYGVWQQLSLAELIPGAYTGSGPDALIGSNVPVSAYEGGGHDMVWFDAPGGWADQLGRSLSGNYLRFGKEGITTGQNDLLSGGVITGKTARSIDEKIDNALPSYGKVIAERSDASPTTGCYEDDGSMYIASDTTPSCTILFNMGYDGEH